MYGVPETSTEVTERGERLTLRHEPIDHVGAQEAGKDAHAFLTERGVALGDDLLPARTLERADRVAVEIDEVSRCGNGPKIRASPRASHEPRGEPPVRSDHPRAASSSGRAGDF